MGAPVGRPGLAPRRLPLAPAPIETALPGPREQLQLQLPGDTAVRPRRLDMPRPVRLTGAAADPAGAAGAVRDTGYRLRAPVGRLRPAQHSARIALADRLTAGWPLRLLLVAFPLWWVLGLSTLIFPVLAVPMLIELRRRARTTRILVPPAFWMWGAFLAWQLIGLLLLSLSPPGTHPGSVGGRIVSLTLTAVEYAGVTITLLYVGNLRRSEVPAAAIARWLGYFFVTVLAGGVLGLAAPRFSFRSVIEIVLPHRIAAEKFVASLVHPVAAQVQDVIGVGDGRPAAPFGYTNTWGNALSLLLVWFVAAFVLPVHGRRRVLAVAVAAVSLVPIVLSLNRGLWIGIGVTVVWLIGRQLLHGRIGAVLLVLAGTGLAVLVAAVSPLAPVVSARLDHGGVSDNIRKFVAHLSWVAVRHSPIVGYGGTRHANGSAASIAIGPTPSCASCGDVPTGSTGLLWQLLFDHGVVGALLYFGFFAAILSLCWRQRGVIAEAALVTIALSFVYMFFYSAVPVAPTVTMIAVGLLWRDRAAQRGATQHARDDP